MSGNRVFQCWCMLVSSADGDQGWAISSRTGAYWSSGRNSPYTACRMRNRACARRTTSSEAEAKSKDLNASPLKVHPAANSEPGRHAWCQRWTFSANVALSFMRWANSSWDHDFNAATMDAATSKLSARVSGPSNWLGAGAAGAKVLAGDNKMSMGQNSGRCP